MILEDFVQPNVEELLIWIKSEIKFQQASTSAFTKQSKSFRRRLVDYIFNDLFRPCGRPRLKTNK